MKTEMLSKTLRNKIDDKVCFLMEVYGPDGHIDGHDKITDYICELLEDENKSLQSKIQALEEKLRIARSTIHKFRKHFTDCSNAGFSNMEGADEKDFLYWEKWHIENQNLVVEANTALANIRPNKDEFLSAIKEKQE